MNTSVDAQRLDATFFALSDATRREILFRLGHGELTVNQLTVSFAISQPAISRHLQVLEKAGLIRRSRDAQRRPATIETKPIVEAVTWIKRYQALWEGNYERLDALLANDRKAKKRR